MSAPTRWPRWPRWPRRLLRAIERRGYLSAGEAVACLETYTDVREARRQGRHAAAALWDRGGVPEAVAFYGGATKLVRDAIRHRHHGGRR